MRRRLACTLLAAAAAAALLVVPAAGARSRGSTTTPVRFHAPGTANATVVGFTLDLVRTKGRKATVARARAVAAKALPKNMSVYSVLGKQKRSDRVNGVLVAVNRATKVVAPARAHGRNLTIDLKHAAIPRGFRVALKVTQAPDVLLRHRGFRCSRYFRRSDLRTAGRLAGPGLAGISASRLIAAACSSAASRRLYPAEGALLGALGGRSGTLRFRRSAAGVDGKASFNYPVAGFAVRADKRHHFSTCAFTAGTCSIRSSAHKHDFAVFKPTVAPASPGTQFAFSLGVKPSARKGLPFQFVGITKSGARVGPLLTAGP